jgi:hypothetical protein
MRALSAACPELQLSHREWDKPDAGITERESWFWLGEVVMAAVIIRPRPD